MSGVYGHMFVYNPGHDTREQSHSLYIIALGVEPSPLDQCPMQSRALSSADKAAFAAGILPAATPAFAVAA